jgi:nitroreductase
MTYNINEVNTLIRNRRSIYPNMYTGEKIDDGIIIQMLENANWAPTHKLTEPWRFVVFTGDGLKKLAAFQAGLYKQKSQADGTYSEVEFNKLLSKPLSASHIISIGMRRDEKKRLPEIEEVAAVACAVQNMYLTAEAYGAGCYWGTGGVTYYEEAKEFFGLGENDLLMGFFYVGVPKMHPKSGRRKPAEDKVRWEK